MDTAGLANYTYTFDISEASAKLLNDEHACQAALKGVIADAGMTELHSLTHHFTPQGISVVTLLAESHIALHTWPELRGGYVTLTTCKKPHQAFSTRTVEILQETFAAQNVSVKEVL